MAQRQVDLFPITINWKGEDIMVDVDYDTANELINDPQKAEEFLKKHNLIEVKKDVWSIRNQSHKATEVFLELRMQYASKFDDRKSSKAGLWQKIAVEMKIMGFDVGDGKEGGERCRQKFANLQRSYVNFKKHMKTTGEEKRNPPPFFDEMDKILGHKDKISPSYLEDSLSESKLCEESTSGNIGTDTEDLEDSEPPAKKKILNRFHTAKNIRPKKNNEMLEVLQEIKNQRERHFQILQTSLNKDAEQKERIIALLEKNLSKQ